jgi:hypothetical protein
MPACAACKLLDLRGLYGVRRRNAARMRAPTAAGRAALAKQRLRFLFSVLCSAVKGCTVTGQQVPAVFAKGAGRWHNET